MTKTEAIHALRAIADAIIEAVREAGPEGASASMPYLAMMEFDARSASLSRSCRGWSRPRLRSEAYYFVVP